MTHSNRLPDGSERAPRILVVEDEDAIRRLVSATLRSRQYEVAEVPSVAEALVRLTEGPYDLVVLDLMLGGVSGWELVEELHRRGLRDRTRVLVLTARSAEGDFLQGWRHGVDHYATKPFDPSELLKAVEDVLLAPVTFLHSHREEELERSRVLSLVEMAFRGLPEA